MKKGSIIMTLLAAIVAIGTTSFAEEKQETPKKKQTHCAVMTKNPINKNLFVDVNGKRIYVCCAGCIGKIKADPDKYIKQLEDEGIALEKAPEKDKAESKTEESSNDQQ